MKLPIEMQTKYPYVKGILLFVFIVYGDHSDLTEERIQEVKNHEPTHYEQAKELWFIGFYILWVLQWIWYVLILQKSYKKIPLEAEAFANQHNPNYNKTRKRFAWRNYL